MAKQKSQSLIAKEILLKKYKLNDISISFDTFRYWVKGRTKWPCCCIVVAEERRELSIILVFFMDGVGIKARRI